MTAGVEDASHTADVPAVVLPFARVTCDTTRAQDASPSHFDQRYAAAEDARGYLAPFASRARPIRRACAYSAWSVQLLTLGHG